jgi:hypothetical protein
MSLKLQTLAQITIASAATRQQVSSSAIAVSTVIFSAPSANTGDIYVGDSNTSATRCVIVPKGTTISITADMFGKPGGSDLLLSDLYVDAATSNDKVNVSYLARRS